MVEYNIFNLSGYDFEKFSVSLMKEKFGLDLHRSAEGPDGGIDLCNHDKSIVVQTKRYKNYSDLEKTLKSEIKKVKLLNPCPREYYLITSLALSFSQRNKILSDFKPYMKDLDNIIDGNDIDDILNANPHILEKNYKLWLNSSNIISLLNNRNITIDSDYIIDEIKEKKDYFVKTNEYEKALKNIEDKKILIITGNPGTGKTTLSYMLILKFLSDGYTLHYSSTNKIETLKNVSGGAKEIIFIDDFLGQSYLYLMKNTLEEITSLVSYVRRNDIILIMNTRISIYNSTKEIDDQFNIKLEKHSQVINLDESDIFDKAHIFYNHLVSNKVPLEYYLNIKNEKNYVHIVEHKNYNPRIIEYVTSTKNYSTVEPNCYSKYIIKNLDNPNQIWKNDYEKRIELNDRIFLNTLISLTIEGSFTTKSVKLNQLRQAFNCRIRCNSDSTIDHFGNVARRLTDSYIKLQIRDDEQVVLTANPSINDFLRSNLRSNENEQKTIIEYSIYSEQIANILSLGVIPATKSEIEKIVNLKSINETQNEILLKYIIKNNYKNLDVRDIICSSIGNYLKECKFYEVLIAQLIKHELHIYYNLIELFFKEEYLPIIIRNIEFNTLKLLINKAVSCDVVFTDNLLKIIDENAIPLICKKSADDIEVKIFEDELYSFDFESVELDTDSIYEIFSDEISRILKNKINWKTNLTMEDFYDYELDPFEYIDENQIIDQICDLKNDNNYEKEYDHHTDEKEYSVLFKKNYY